MTKVECENALLELMREAQDIYSQFSPEGQSLIMSAGDGHINVTGYTSKTDKDGYTVTDICAWVTKDGTVCHYDRRLTA